MAEVLADNLGRIVIPNQIRKSNNIKHHDFIWIGEYQGELILCKTDVPNNFMKYKKELVNGMIKEVDPHGRVLVPKQYREKYMEKGAVMVIKPIPNSKFITINKSVEGCIHCGGTNELFQLNKWKICASCRNKIMHIENCNRYQKASNE